MSLELDTTYLKESFSLFLSEGYASAKKKYVDSGLLDIDILDDLRDIDPTKQKKYVEWMAKMYVEGLGGRDKLEIIKDFDELLKKNKIKNRDINQYKTPEAVVAAIDAAKVGSEEKGAAKKESLIRKMLTELEGVVGKTYKFLNKKYYSRDDEGNFVLTDPDNPGYIPREMIQGIRDEMAQGDIGRTWKKFTIDDDILDHIDPADIRLENNYVVVVEPTSKEKAQFYARNVWFDPNKERDRYNKHSHWCVAYADDEGCLWDTYAFHAEAQNKNKWDRFYVVLPKDIKYVDRKEHAKLMVEAEANGNRKVWDTNDDEMSESEIKRLFQYWDLPWGDDEE